MAKIENIITESIENSHLGGVTSYDLISSGYTSLAYLVSSSDGEFIALTPKKGGLAWPNYAYSFSILKTLEQIDYKFAPKAIYINPERSVIIMTKAPGQKMSWINQAPESKQKQVITILLDALLELQKVQFEKCNDLYKQLTGQKLQAITIQKNVNHFMTEWYKMAQSGQPNPEITRWVRPKISMCQQFAQHAKPSNKIILAHGDTSEGNVLLTDDFRLSLIDWDSGGFYQYPSGWDDFGIAYLFNHLPLCQKHRPFVITYASDKLQIRPTDLEETIIKSQELIKLGDIMWAYMMNARAASGEIDGNPDKFLQIARQRIFDYETTFAKNSFLN